MKYYLIPEEDLKKLDKERMGLHQGIADYEEQNNVIIPISDLTYISWKITHKRYKWLWWWK